MPVGSADRERATVEARRPAAAVTHTFDRAMGGHLEIVATFPDGAVRLTQLGEGKAAGGNPSTEPSTSRLRYVKSDRHRRTACAASRRWRSSSSAGVHSSGAMSAISLASAYVLVS